MTWITTIIPEQARGWRRLVMRLVKRQNGFVPGILQILLGDVRLALPVLALYHYLHERKRSPLSQLQREMIATVVNGAIGGAP
jgi:hypothetical protein